MTGAGSATLAFAKESSFLGSLIDSDADGTPEYYAPGRNPTVENAELSNQLTRMREAGLVEAADSLAGNLEGALSVSWTMSKDTHTHVRDIVFNDAGGGFVSGNANTSRWFLGIDYIGGTTERVLKGCIPLTFSLSYNQGQPVQVSLTMGYADEVTNTSTTPSSVIGPTDGNDVPHHGTDLTVDAASVSKLQSATLTISNIARFHRGTSRKAVDAVIAAPETSLEATAIYEGSSYLELAYGASASTTPQDQLTNVAGSLAFDTGGTGIATYDLPKLKPDSYNWSDLVSADADITEPVSYHVNGGVTVA